MSDYDERSVDENSDIDNDDDYQPDIDEFGDAVDETAKDAEEKKEDDENDDTYEPQLEDFGNTKGLLRSRLPKITETERSSIIGRLAQKIEDSEILIPDGYENLLFSEKGSSIEIAMLWFKYRKIVPLPIEIIRTAYGKNSIRVDPNNLPYRGELVFRGVDF